MRIVFLRPFHADVKLEKRCRNIGVLQKIAPGYETIALANYDRRMRIDNEMNIAEVGVYKGQFARIINQKFPEDTFYLFDTFEGFDETEAQRELEEGNCNNDFIEFFKETSVEEVMAKLKHKENCVICKGLFPESAKDIDTAFKFVSIDVDFQNSIYEAMTYFYPKLVQGGFIFVHDYNDPKLKGVKKAIDIYEKEHGALIKIPVADKSGTLIITK